MNSKRIKIKLWKIYPKISDHLWHSLLQWSDVPWESGQYIASLDRPTTHIDIRSMIVRLISKLTLYLTLHFPKCSWKQSAVLVSLYRPSVGKSSMVETSNKKTFEEFVKDNPLPFWRLEENVFNLQIVVNISCAVFRIICRNFDQQFKV